MRSEDEIKDKEIAELEAENDRLKKKIKQLEDFIKSDGEIDHINHEYTYKLKQTLQEIKGYLNTLSGVDNDFVNTETYLRILDLITKAESGDNQ